MKQDAEALRHVKADLRASALALRDGLDPAFRTAASAQVVALALPLFQSLPVGAVVAGFFPMRSEIDPRPLMQALVGEGFSLSLPCVTKEGLVFRQWTYGDPLAKRRFGLSEPLDSAALVTPCAFIVPLAAFDRRGHRIGYGAGHYDRALGQAPDALKIGICFAAQEVPAVPDEAYDQALDAVVTEEGVVRPPRT
jgi:5-formyltetrahydrofolate cyclo-ligase